MINPLNEQNSLKTPVPTTGEIYENLKKSGRFKRFGGGVP